MNTIHSSRNLRIEYDPATKDIHFTLTFHEERVTGSADGACPMCGGDTNLVLWELEGPDGNANTVWLTCAKACAERGEEVRWSRPVAFAGPWESPDAE